MTSIDGGGSDVIKGGSLEPAQQGKDLLERAADMESRYRARIKAQRERLETMQHRLLELIGVVAEARQTIDEDWIDIEDGAEPWADWSEARGYVDDLVGRLRSMLASGVSGDRRVAERGLDGGDEEHAKMVHHLVEDHRLDQVYSDMTNAMLAEVHTAMHATKTHKHRRAVENMGVGDQL